MKKILSNSIVILLIAVVVGLFTGRLVGEEGIRTILSIKQITGQIIFFLVPLIVIGFVAPSITALRQGATRLIFFAFLLAYVSSVGAATFAALVGYQTIPLLNIRPAEEGLRQLPELIFRVDIPPIMSVMSALLLAVFLGFGALRTSAVDVTRLLQQFRDIVLLLVRRVLMPVLPVYIAANFAALSYEGDVARLGIFLPVLAIIIVCQYLWLTLLYGTASAYSQKNGWKVLRYYGPAYLTAWGTMSSAATLGVSLDGIRRSPILSRKVTDFSIPLFANIHLCGSVFAETFLVCVVSQLLYGHLPDPATMTLFIVLLGIFAVGAPGVPGGTVLASLGIVTSVLGFGDSGTALLIAIFALQDGFGTACNITGDGALSLITDTYAKRHVPDLEAEAL